MANLLQPFNQRKNQRPLLILFNAAGGTNPIRALDIPQDLVFVASYERKMDINLNEGPTVSGRAGFRCFNFRSNQPFSPPHLVRVTRKQNRDTLDITGRVAAAERQRIARQFRGSLVWRLQANQITRIRQVARNADHRWNGKVVVYGHSTLGGRYISDLGNRVNGTDLAHWLETEVYARYFTRLREEIASGLQNGRPGLGRDSVAKRTRLTKELRGLVERNVTVYACYAGDADSEADRDDEPVVGRLPARLVDDAVILREMEARYQMLRVPYRIKGAKTVVSGGSQSIGFIKRDSDVGQVGPPGETRYRRRRPDRQRRSDQEETQRRTDKGRVVATLDGRAIASDDSLLRCVFPGLRPIDDNGLRPVDDNGSDD